MVTPFFFGPAERRLFGLFESGSAAGRGNLAILLCNPHGQEAITVHRLYRVLSARLAQQGCDVLRFDYYGTGDSGGGDRDGELEGWTNDVRTAHDELLRRSAARRVAWMGARLGATLAVRASRSLGQALSRLVLWAPVVDGAAYVEEMRELHRRTLADALAGSPNAETRSALPEPAADEFLGFEISGLLRRQLGELAPPRLPIPRTLHCTLLHEPAAAPSVLVRWRDSGLRVSVESLSERFDWTWFEPPQGGLVPHEPLQALVRMLGTA